MQIKLLVASPDERLRHELRTWFAQASCTDIQFHESEPTNLLHNLATVRPGVLMIEHAAGGAAGWKLVVRLRQLAPQTRLLLLCEAQTQEMIVSFIKQGVSGWLLKSSAPALFEKAVRSVSAGQSWYGRSELHDALQRQIALFAQPVAATGRSDSDDAVLTTREQEILDLIGAALTNKEIGRRLEISDKTVKTHLHHIYVKLNRSGRYKVLLSQGNLPVNPLLARAARDAEKADGVQLPIRTSRGSESLSSE